MSIPKDHQDIAYQTALNELKERLDTAVSELNTFCTQHRDACAAMANYFDGSVTSVYGDGILEIITPNGNYKFTNKVE